MPLHNLFFHKCLIFHLIGFCILITLLILTRFPIQSLCWIIFDRIFVFIVENNSIYFHVPHTFIFSIPSRIRIGAPPIKPYLIIATHQFHFQESVNSHPSNVRHFHFSIGRFCVYTLHKDVLYASDVFICLVRLDFHLSICSQCESFKLPLSELQFLCVCSTKHINKLELFFPLSVSLYLCLSTASDCVDILFSSIAAHIRTACFLSSIR